MFSWCRCLVVGLVFSHLGFWSGSLFLIAHFPDLCLLVLFDDTFYDNVKSHKRLLEDNMLDPLFISNPHINSNITLDEVAAAIIRPKSYRLVE